MERGAAAARDFRVEIWGRGREFRGREIAEGKYSGSGVPVSGGKGDRDEDVPRASGVGKEGQGTERTAARKSPWAPRRSRGV